MVIPNLPVNARWEQQGVTVAGGRGAGANNNQLNWPRGLFVDDDDDPTIVIADHDNHRIMQWKKGDTQGQVVAGGNGRGNRLDQLNQPTDVLIDKVTNSLIIADSVNARVIRWSREDGTRQGEILIEGITPIGLAMAENGDLYVSTAEGHAVYRYKIDSAYQETTLAAGGHGPGDQLYQLNYPDYLFVDRNQSLYVSEWTNCRVTKWTNDPANGVVVAQGQNEGSHLTMLHRPCGLSVDTMGTLYVADFGNKRVLRWPQGSNIGTAVVGTPAYVTIPDQSLVPAGLSFDKDGNLYVAESCNNRVQRFNIIK